MNIFDIWKNQKMAVAKSAKMADERKRKSRVEAIPFVALGVANLIVLTLDYRVFDAIYRITGSVALALFAILPTGAMFILWFDVLYQYLLANDNQKRLAIGGSVSALLAAAAFAFLDYGTHIDLGKGVSVNMDYNAIFGAMIALTVLHCGGLFAWYLSDEQVTRERNAAKEKANSEFNLKSVDIANDVMERVEKVLTRRQELEQRFGREMVSSVLDSLAGLETIANADINGDGVIGKPVMQTLAAESKTGVELQNPTRGGK